MALTFSITFFVDGIPGIRPGFWTALLSAMKSSKKRRGRRNSSIFIRYLDSVLTRAAVKLGRRVVVSKDEDDGHVASSMCAQVQT